MVPFLREPFAAPPALGQNNVKLIVYDIIGREVAILVNEKQRPGKYQITWEASEYPSGIYFYNLKTNIFHDTKKMILIK